MPSTQPDWKTTFIQNCIRTLDDIHFTIVMTTDAVIADCRCRQCNILIYFCTVPLEISWWLHCNANFLIIIIIIMAASNKTAKYAGLTTDYHFQPIAVVSLGPANESAVDFLTTLGNKIAQQTGDERETAFLFQHLSVLVQRFNCVLLHNSLSMMTAPIKWHSSHFLFLIFYSNNNNNNSNNNVNLSSFSSSFLEFPRQPRLSTLSGEERESHYLFHHLSVAIKQFNLEF